jgi:hypothetical protein
MDAMMMLVPLAHSESGRKDFLLRKLPVNYLCYYLADWIGIVPRPQDRASANVVRCLKDKPVEEQAALKVGNTTIHLDPLNTSEFLPRLWGALGDYLGNIFDSQAAIIPVPDSLGRQDALPIYRTYRYAQAIAAGSSGKLVAHDSLRWKQNVPDAPTRVANRHPETRYNNLVVTSLPKLPIVLFDDTLTSGSSLIAAHWRLAEAGNAPARALVIARRTNIPQADMFKGGEYELNIWHLGQIRTQQ